MVCPSGKGLGFSTRVAFMSVFSQRKYVCWAEKGKAFGELSHGLIITRVDSHKTVEHQLFWASLW